MSPEVVELTLRDIRSQSLAISIDEQRGRENVDDFQWLMQQLEREGVLDRALENLPSLEVLNERRTREEALTRPELALMLAYSKLWLKQQLLASELPDDSTAEAYLDEYFPQMALTAAGAEALRDHRLSREIIVMQMVNDMADLMGATFINRMMRDTGSTPAEITRAWLIASSLCGARELRDTLARVESDLPTPALYRWLRGLERVLERTARWVLGNVSPETPAAVVIAEHKNGLERMRGHFHEVAADEERGIFDTRVRELQELTGDAKLAEQLITLRYLDQLLEILRVARETGADPMRAARAYYQFSELLGVPWLRESLTRAAQTRWGQRLAQGLLTDLGRAHRAFTAAAVDNSAASEPVESLVADLRERMAADLAEFSTLMDEIRADTGDPDVTALAVAVRKLRNISRRV
jgi:glutamate dehydrogenase